MRIGIDLGGTKIEIIALANDGIEIYRERVSTPKDYQLTMHAIKQLISNAEKATQQTGSVGIGIPGTVSPYTGLIKNANSVWLNNHNLQQDLAKLLNRPIKLANDANCLAVSEATDGAGQGKYMVFAVIIGTGCGGGIAINGQCHAGINGVAGEWGHNMLPWMDSSDHSLLVNNPCYCGKQGCVEQFLSGTGFEYDYFKSSTEKINGQSIALKAHNGDTNAAQVLQRYEQRLAKSLAALINLMDPDVIVLGGGMSNVEHLYLALPPLIKPWVFGGECATPIVKAKHGDSSGVRGAAWLWPAI